MSKYSQCGELSATGISPIILSMLMDDKQINERVKALDKRRGKNLKRLRLKMGWSQEKLAEKTGIGQTKISAYENGLGFDKETLIRLCSAFGVQDWEFDWDEDTPIVLDKKEMEDLKRIREAERIGIADMVREAEASWISAAKKKERPVSEGTKDGVPRSGRRRAS